jgi:hypothetical protein
MDGRYLTGSVGATTDAAICSICKQDWVVDGPCDHEPGQMYDSIPGFLITGNLKYGEYSIVNMPADPLSQVLEFVTDGVSTKREIANSEYGVEILMENIQSSDMVGVVITDAQAPAKTEIIVADVQTVPAAEVVVVVDVASVQDTALQTETLPVEATVPAPVADTKPTVEDVLQKLFETDKGLSDEDVEFLYAEQETLLDAEAVDAKLSTETRKKMASSSFCGPNRSFPVPDCAHYTAAKRLIGKYKGPGDQSSIMACVERKGKALGCPSAKASKPADAEILPVDTQVQDATFCPCSVVPLDKFTDEQLLAIHEHLKSKIAIPEDTLLKASLEQEKELCKVVADLEGTIGTLRDEASVLVFKYDASLEDMHQQQEMLCSDKAKTRALKINYLRLLALVGEKKMRDAAEFSALSEEVVDAEIEKTQVLVDMEKIYHKLNDGMSRIPDGQAIDNPVLTIDTGKTPKDEAKVVLTVDKLKEIERQYTTLLFQPGAGAEAAKAYIASLQAIGVIPKN